jgi:hypothetical protein
MPFFNIAEIMATGRRWVMDMIRGRAANNMKDVTSLLMFSMSLPILKSTSKCLDLCI